MKKCIFILIITLLGLHGPFNSTVYGEAIYVTHNANQQPQIGLNRTELYFGAVEGGTTGDPQTFLVSNSGSGTLNWIVTANSNWVTYSPEFGTNSDIVTITVDPSSFSTGSYSARLAVSDLDASNSPQFIDITLDVHAPGTTDTPFGTFAVPDDPAVVSGSVPLTGWALDDIGVENVKLYRLDGADLIYFGDAVFVEGARTDVEQAYPTYPNNYNAGWGYMLLTNFLPDQGNGTFAFYAIADDKEGNQTILGSRTITCNNADAVKPFGAIDTPNQGGTVSGTAFRNHGWVLTPLPNKIPVDGSTIECYIDSVKIGTAVYDRFREDIARLFPGYANSNGAHAYFDFDTTIYDTGVHSIVWTARDDAGNSDGIGSRFFTVRNTGEGRGTTGDEGRGTRDEGDGGPGVTFKKGYDKSIEAQSLYPDDTGIINIEIHELELLELHLPFRKGFQLVGDQLRPLPIGSTLDAQRGIFYWLPAAGFVGDYELVFLNAHAPNSKKIRLSVRIKHKDSL